MSIQNTPQSPSSASAPISSTSTSPAIQVGKGSLGKVSHLLGSDVQRVSAGKFEEIKHTTPARTSSVKDEHQIKPKNSGGFMVWLTRLFQSYWPKSTPKPPASSSSADPLQAKLLKETKTSPKIPEAKVLSSKAQLAEAKASIPKSASSSVNVTSEQKAAPLSEKAKAVLDLCEKDPKAAAKLVFDNVENINYLSEADCSAIVKNLPDGKDLEFIKELISLEKERVKADPTTFIRNVTPVSRLIKSYYKFQMTNVIKDLPVAIPRENLKAKLDAHTNDRDALLSARKEIFEQPTIDILKSILIITAHTPPKIQELNRHLPFSEQNFFLGVINPFIVTDPGLTPVQRSNASQISANLQNLANTPQDFGGEIRSTYDQIVAHIKGLPPS